MASNVRADIVRELHEGLRSIRQELATVRVQTRQDLATARVEMHQLLAASRVEALRWSFVFWVGQVAAMAGLLALMFRRTGR